ncbi:MAG: type II restriction endonuclease [Sulfurovum sp.]|nr:type II restriction endonuclease [Sulfurovum sp.]
MSVKYKKDFEQHLKLFVKTLSNHISTEDGQWSIKGFIDTYKNIYTISNDTKIVSKILEIHLFPKIVEFAQTHGYKVVLAEHQNYYPDVSLVKIDNAKIKFALDFKTTYRNPKKPFLCNGFTLGSHGKYFEDRRSTKNIQFPYSHYLGHFCLGIIYDRNEKATIDETKSYQLNELDSIESVVNNFHFFAVEKWKIASDKGGSGNTANIGSINNIKDISNGNGMFSKLGEKWFDDYWMNFNKITISKEDGTTKKINTLKDFVEYRKGDSSLIVAKNNKSEE